MKSILQEFKQHLTEEINNVTVLFPGGFKPITGAHLALANRYAENPAVQQVIMLIGPKERDGFTRTQTIQAFNLLNSNPKIRIEPTEFNSPIMAAYEYLFALPENATGQYAMAASAKGDDYVRTKSFVPNIDKYKITGDKKGRKIPRGVDAIELTANTDPIAYPDGEPVSATSTRAAIADGDYRRFKESYPGVTDSVLKNVWEIFTGKMIETIFSKEWWTSQLQEDIETVIEGYMDSKTAEKHKKKIEKLRKFLDTNTGKEFVYDFNTYDKTTFGVPLTENYITRQELSQIESAADRFFKQYGIDVDMQGKFTHFFDRLNDPRNDAPIYMDELEDMFRELADQYGEDIASQMQKRKDSAVVSDLATDVPIHMPFMLRYDKRDDEIKLIPRTIKKQRRQWQSNNPQDVKYYIENITEVGEANATTYDWKQISNEFASDVNVVFTSDSGLDYNVTLEPREVYLPLYGYRPNKHVLVYTIDFGIDYDDKISSTGETNRGELYKVMSTISDIVKTYLNKRSDIQGIRYYPVPKNQDRPDSQRRNLYNAFVKHAMPGAKISTSESGYVLVLNPSYDPENAMNESALITEGGAAGHMAHPYDDHGLTFNEMKELIARALEGQLDIEEAVTEKTDGQNLQVTWKNGQVGFARNKGTIKKPLTTQELIGKFEGRGPISDAFKEAGQDLQAAFSKIDSAKLNQIFKNGRVFANMEIIYPATKNIINYDKAHIQFHNLVEYDENANKVETDMAGGALIQKIIEDANAHMQNTFSFIPPQKIKLGRVADFEDQQAALFAEVDQLKNQFQLKDTDLISDYHRAWWRDVIETKAQELGYELSEDLRDTLVDRWAFGDKSTSITALKKQIENPEFLQWVTEFDKKDFKSYQKQNMEPFESIFLRLGALVLSNTSEFLAANPNKAVQEIKRDIASLMKQVQSSKDPDILKKVEYQLKRIEKLGGFDKIVPIEGIVFTFKGDTYKLTGAFAPVNQLIGILKYGR